jgi:hypothetical protein
MSMPKTILISLVKYVLLSVCFLVLYMIGSAVFSVRMAQTPPPGQQSQILIALLLIALIDTFVISLVIVRSVWSGVRLALATMFAWYGTMTFMTQIESTWFGPSLGIGSDMLPALFLNSVPLVLIFSPLAVFFWGKWRPTPERIEGGRLPQTAPEWLWKLAVIAALYVTLYFSFGYWVAWQNPALREMYGNGANQQVFDNTRLVPFQVLRSMLWLLFTLPVVRMTRGPVWSAAIVVGLLLALPPTIALIIPFNPIMPDPSVRLSHLVETTTSDFIYGVCLTFLLQWRPALTTRGASQLAKP